MTEAKAKHSDLGAVLSRVRRRVTVVDGMSYPAVSVLKEGAGLGPKEPFVGGITGYETLFQVRAGDVVVRTITAFESPVAVAEERHDGMHVSQVFLTYEVSSEVLPAYLAYFFKSPAFWDEMNNRATGTVLRRKTISDAAFRGVPIRVPSLPEQRRIVAVLSAVDSVVECVENEIDSARSSFRAALAHFFSVDSAAATSKISDCATLVTGRAFPVMYQGRVEGEIPYVKVSDLGRTNAPRRVTTATNWVGATTAKELTARVCPAGTVLFPIIGAAMLTEKRRILAREAAFDQNIMGLVPNDRVVPEYLFAAMSSLRLGDLRQTGAVPSVNQLLVGAIEILLPPKEDQEEIAASVDSVLDVVERLSFELAALRTVRADLLSALLSQDITVDVAVDKFMKAG